MMKVMNKTNLLIIIMLCLGIMVFNIFYMREGMDNALTILNQDTKGNCVYNKKGIKSLNSDDGIQLSWFNNKNVGKIYNESCRDRTNQVMCERAHYPSSNGKHVINYCDWELGE